MSMNSEVALISEEASIVAYRTRKSYVVIHKNNSEVIHLGSGIQGLNLDIVHNPNKHCVISGLPTDNEIKSTITYCETYKDVSTEDAIDLAHRIVKKSPGDDIYVLKSTGYKTKGHIVWKALALLRQVRLRTIEHEEQLPDQAITVPPSLCERITKGQKTVIIKSEDSDDIKPGKKFILASDNFAYGVIELNNSRAIDLNEFEAEQARHCITTEMRKKLFPRKRKLFAFDVIGFTPLDVPSEFNVHEDPESSIVKRISLKSIHEEEEEEQARQKFDVELITALKQDFTDKEKACISRNIKLKLEEGMHMQQAIAASISICAPKKTRQEQEKQELGTDDTIGICSVCHSSLDMDSDCGGMELSKEMQGNDSEALEKDNEERITYINRLIKSEERIVVGVVLEPETVDSQGDIYSEQEVELAADRFMEHYRTFKLMHEGKPINDKVTPLQSYTVPADFEINGDKVKKGTWLLKLRVNDETIWQQIKSGKLTGFSIGGHSAAKQLA